MKVWETLCVEALYQWLNIFWCVSGRHGCKLHFDWFAEAYCKMVILVLIVMHNWYLWQQKGLPNAQMWLSGNDCRISIAVTCRKLLLSPKTLTSTFNKKWIHSVNCLIYLIVIQVMHWTCEDFTYCISPYQHVTLSGKKTNPFTLPFFFSCLPVL